jgi:hypothetical protein
MCLLVISYELDAFLSNLSIHTPMGAIRMDD